MRVCLANLASRLPALLVGSLVGLAAWADVVPGPTPSFAHDNPVALPGVGKVLGAFVVTVAVGFAAAYALRRWLPKWAGQSKLAPGLQVRAQMSLQPGLRLHVVEVQGSTVLIAESKHGIAMSIVPRAEPLAKPDQT
jgi:hypothetical protein